jgi:hypothetical protein
VNKFTIIILATLTTLLAGCNPNESIRNMMNRMAPDDDEALAQEYLDALRSRDIDTAIRLLDPQFNVPGVESNLVVIADILDKGEVVSKELVGCNIHSSSGKRRSNLTYQYQFTNEWVLAAITVDTIDEQKQVFGVNVNPIPKSLGELNAFTFAGKSILYYVILVAAVITPLFMLFSLIVCIRTKMKKRKWLWIIFIIFGFGALSLNWTTGQMNLNPLNFQLFGAGCHKPGLYAQWTISVAFPLGAILFLIRRKKLMKEPEENEHNQQVDPIVKMPVDEVQAQGTQGHP